MALDRPSIGRRSRAPFAIARTAVPVAVALALLTAAFLAPAPEAAMQSGAVAQGSPSGTRSSSVRPKRSKASRAAKSGALLAKTEFSLVGLQGIASPARHAVPKNNATALHTGVDAPDAMTAAQIIAGLPAGTEVRGLLEGTSFSSPVVLRAAVGADLVTPVLTHPGLHRVHSLEIVDATGSHVADVRAEGTDLNVCDIDVFESIVVTNVSVREMSYEELVQAGVTLDDDSYTYYDFTLALGTTSTAHL